jgi:hypothetical protein
MQYQLIRQINSKDFTLAINNFLKDNWELLGTPYILTEKIENVETVVYYQSMIKPALHPRSTQ